MLPVFIEPIVNLITTVVDRIIPDPVAAAQAKLEVAKLAQSGELAQLTADTDLAKGQMAINAEEAKSDNLFVAGWRPFIGWICGLGFGVQFLFGPFLTWGSALLGHPTDFPKLDLSEMMPMLFGMLGLGAYRSYEKAKGVA
jgi:hypothetical protein